MLGVFTSDWPGLGHMTTSGTRVGPKKIRAVNVGQAGKILVRGLPHPNICGEWLLKYNSYDPLEW